MPKHNPLQAAQAAGIVLVMATNDCLAAVRHVTACLARRSQALLGLACRPESAGGGRLVVTVADDGGIGRLVAELAGLPAVGRIEYGDAGAPEFAGLLREGLAA